jgi:hypothetical protein
MDVEKQQPGIAATPVGNDTTSPGESHGAFSWKDVSFSVKTKDGDKQILSNVSGVVEKGSPTPRPY